MWLRPSHADLRAAAHFADITAAGRVQPPSPPPTLMPLATPRRRCLTAVDIDTMPRQHRRVNVPEAARLASTPPKQPTAMPDAGDAASGCRRR